MIPTLSQICSLHSDFESDIEDYAAAPCPAVELWLGKLETWLESHQVSDYQRLLEKHQVVANVASYQGGILASQAQKRREAWGLFKRRLDLCNELDVSTLVVACDVVSPVEIEDVERIQVSLRQAATLAEDKRVRLAVEFQARAAFGNNVQTMVALVDEIASEYLGICLDAFHFHVGPSKIADLELLHSGNLFHVQLSDVADVPREFAMDGHRIMPGEGDVATQAIVARLRDINYSKCVSIEIMNPQIWQVPARQFGEVGMQSLRNVLGET